MSVVAIYCRVSSERQKERQTIATQKRILAEHAKAHRWEIFDWYIDEGLSGTTIERRPAFVRLLRDAEAGRFNIVAVVDVDRLTRSDDPRQRAFVEYVLRSSGVQVAVANSGELLDLANPMHELFHYFKSWYAKEDRKRILQKMADGRLTKAHQGKFLGSRTPYGYRKENMRLQIDPEEAEVVREIFRLYVDKGISMDQIAYYLDGHGYARRNGARWVPTRISQTIKNPTYKGTLYLNRMRAGKPVPQEDWIEIAVPGIVTPEVWHAAQETAKRNRHFSKRRTKRDYLLRGLLYCGECESRMIAKTYYYNGPKGYGKYLCYRREARKRTGGCAGPYVNAPRADAVVWDLIKGLVTDPDLLRQVLERELEERKLVQAAAAVRDFDSLEEGLVRLREGIEDYAFEQRRRLVRLIVPGEAHRIIVEADKTLVINGVIPFADAAAGDHYSEYPPARQRVDKVTSDFTWKVAL